MNEDTIYIKVKKSEIIYFLGILFNILGITVIGLGIGDLFSIWKIGALIGFGLGLYICSFIMLRTARRLDVLKTI